MRAQIRAALLVAAFSSQANSASAAECNQIRECLDEMVEIASDLKRQNTRLEERLAELEENNKSQLEELRSTLTKPLAYKEFAENELAVNNANTYTLDLKSPGILIASLSTWNNEGSSVGGGRHTISSSSRIDVNGALCATDTSAYYVWDGGNQSNATCIIDLPKGSHKLTFRPTVGTAAGRSKRWGKYAVLPISQHP